jgi:hypothetical protein
MFERMQGIFFTLTVTLGLYCRAAPQTTRHTMVNTRTKTTESQKAVATHNNLGSSSAFLSASSSSMMARHSLPELGRFKPGEEGERGEDPGVAGGRVEGAVIVHRRRVRRRRLGVARRALHVGVLGVSGGGVVGGKGERRCPPYQASIVGGTMFVICSWDGPVHGRAGVFHKKKTQPSESCVRGAL